MSEETKSYGGFTTMEALRLAASTGTNVTLTGEQAARIVALVGAARDHAPFIEPRGENSLYEACKRLGMG